MSPWARATPVEKRPFRWSSSSRRSGAPADDVIIFWRSFDADMTQGAPLRGDRPGRGRAAARARHHDHPPPRPTGASSAWHGWTATSCAWARGARPPTRRAGRGDPRRTVELAKTFGSEGPAPSSTVCSIAAETLAQLRPRSSGPWPSDIASSRPELDQARRHGAELPRLQPSGATGAPRARPRAHRLAPRRGPVERRAPARAS